MLTWKWQSLCTIWKPHSDPVTKPVELFHAKCPNESVTDCRSVDFLILGDGVDGFRAKPDPGPHIVIYITLFKYFFFLNDINNYIMIVCFFTCNSQNLGQRKRTMWEERCHELLLWDNLSKYFINIWKEIFSPSPFSWVWEQVILWPSGNMNSDLSNLRLTVLTIIPLADWLFNMNLQLHLRIHIKSTVNTGFRYHDLKMRPFVWLR